MSIYTRWHSPARTSWTLRFALSILGVFTMIAPIAASNPVMTKLLTSNCLAGGAVLDNLALQICTTGTAISGAQGGGLEAGAEWATISLTSPLVGLMSIYLLRDSVIPQQFDSTGLDTATSAAAVIAAIEQQLTSGGVTVAGRPTLQINAAMTTGVAVLRPSSLGPENGTQVLNAYWAAPILKGWLVMEVAEEVASDVVMQEALGRYTNLSVSTQTGSFTYLPLIKQAGGASAASLSADEGAEDTTAALPNLPSPPWWSGVCNTNNYQKAMGRPAFPIGASYRNLQACGPQPRDIQTEPDDRVVTFFPGAHGQLEWQCVELVTRYMYLAYGTNPYKANGNQIVTNYPGTTGVRLRKIFNRTTGEYPKPGDVVSYSSGKYGHTGIVTASSVDAQGNGSYTLFSQNTNRSYATMSIRNWDAIGAGGWLRDPRQDTQPTRPQPTPGRWLAEYRASHDLNSTPSWVQLEDSIDYNWGQGTPTVSGSPLGNDTFSVVWSGDFSFVAGQHIFVGRADDVAKVWVDGALTLTAGQGETTASIQLTAGMHNVRIEYLEFTGPAAVSISWFAPSSLDLGDPARLPAPLGDGFGWKVATGDFDGDGWRDIAVGAPGESEGSALRAGRVYVYRGGINGFSPWQSLGQSPLGTDESDDLFGSSLAIGDFNGDGRDDLAVGAPGEAPGASPRSGYVMVFTGSANGLIPSQGLDQQATRTNELDDRFGFALAAGDFDGDGRDDLAVGAPGEAQGAGPKSGWVFLFRGSAGPLGAWGDMGQDGIGTNELGDRFGTALAAGDVNGDGRDDLAVGAPGESPGVSPQSGYTFLFKGSLSGLTPWQGVDQTLLGTNEAGDRFGMALVIGDLDDDGYEDLVVGAPGEAPGASPASGYVFIYKGGATAVTPWYGLDQSGLGTNEANDRFGMALGLGDIDGNGGLDIVVGAPGEAPGANPPSGFAFAFQNNDGMLVPWRGIDQTGLGGNEANDQFGASVALASLTDGGRAALIVGAPGEAPGTSPASGYAFLFQGTTDGSLPWRGLDQSGLDVNE